MTDKVRAARTPMSDHVARFWKLLETETVRILVDMKRTVGADAPDGPVVYYDSSSFGDDVAKALVASRLASLPAPLSEEEMAETVHKARWPEDCQAEITPFSSEDRDGREYCLRIARAILTRLGQQGSAERKIPEHIAKAINDLCDYAQDLDLTERPAIGEYDVTADIRTVCDFGVNAYLGQPIPPPKP